MNKAELESKHIAELHELAADAGVERYRMLPRAELIEKLAGGGSAAGPQPKRERAAGDSGRGGSAAQPQTARAAPRPRAARRAARRADRASRGQSGSEPPAAPARAARAAPATHAAASSAERPKRKRRRRWGRRRKGVRVHDLLLPAASGRQAIVYAESRAACTALLREVAAELSGRLRRPRPDRPARRPDTRGAGRLEARGAARPRSSPPAKPTTPRTPSPRRGPAPRPART